MYRSTYFAGIARPGKRTAVLGVAALVVSLGACSDSATAPTSSAREIAGPSSMLVGNGGGNLATFATATVVDIFGVKINDKFNLEVRFTSQPSGWTKVVKDNDSTDYDATPGVIKAAIKPGSSYQVCFEDAYFYMNDNRDPDLYPQCRTVTTSSYNVTFPNIFGRRYPKLAFVSKDIFGNLLIPGGSVQITAFGWTQVIQDGNDKNFGGEVDGVVNYQTRYPPTKWTWCEYKAPLKYVLVSPKCGTIDAKFDMTHVVIWTHEQAIY